MRLRDYLELLRPHRGALVVAAALLAVGGALPGVAVWLLQGGLRRLDDPLGLAAIAGTSVGLVLAYTTAQVGRAAITRRVGARVASDLRLRVLEAWLRREGTVGDGLSALLDEVDQVQYGVSALVTALRNPIALLGLIGSALALAPSVALLALLLFSGVAALGIWSSRTLKSATGTARAARAALAGLAAEQVANAEVIRAYDALPDELRRFRDRDDADREARVALELARVLPSSVVEVAAALAVAVVLVVGAVEVGRGWLDGPSLLAAVAALLLANRPLAGLAEVQSLLARSLAALERVGGLLAADRAPPPRAEVPSGPLSLAWDGVSVALGERIVVQSAQVEAHPGELVALVGPSGAGKTTLLRAALGAVPLAAGVIRVGGVEDGARTDVAFVPQDIGLFARTVAENVALGKARAEPERLARALAEAGARFAAPERVLGERGRGLSGGERQRLCLARGLYRDARILLLDEPTAQLDAATSAGFAETLRSLRAGRTIVVATHDPEVWSRADRVYEVEGGRVSLREERWTASRPS